MEFTGFTLLKFASSLSVLFELLAINLLAPLFYWLKLYSPKACGLKRPRPVGGQISKFSDLVFISGSNGLILSNFRFKRLQTSCEFRTNGFN